MDQCLFEAAPHEILNWVYQSRFLSDPPSFLYMLSVFLSSVNSKSVREGSHLRLSFILTISQVA